MFCHARFLAKWPGGVSHSKVELSDGVYSLCLLLLVPEFPRVILRGQDRQRLPSDNLTAEICVS